MTKQISQKLGKYEIIEEMGRGGFATVYRVRDPGLDREVALKVLHPLLMRGPEWVARFRREARAVARLDHSHIVTIYEVGQAEGLLYIAMRLVADGSLAQRIAKDGPLPWAELVQLVEQIASALDYAHDQGVIHRDLKAANVLLDSERGAQLTDFGFARMVSESTYSTSISGGVVGTPHYIAPEVWEDKPATTQTDVYALGCILYEMVIGEHLFQGDTTPAVMRAHFQPLKVQETWPEGVPSGLGEVLHTALAKEPESRYLRAGELSEALAALKTDELAEPYAELEAAVAAEAWEQAIELAGKIRAEDPEYRDVAALEETALDGLEGAARRREAATWREEAQRALGEGDLRGAELAARQWQSLTPDAAETHAFLAKLKVRRQAIEEGREAAARKKEELVKILEAEKKTRTVEPAPGGKVKSPFFTTPPGIGIIVVVLAIACIGGLLWLPSILRGCTPRPSEVTPAPPSPAAPPKDTATSASLAATQVPPTEGTPYKIGFFASITGGMSSLGVPERSTAEMIATQLEEAGGLLGPHGVVHRIEIIIYDDESNADVAATAASRLIQQDEVDVIVGGSGSGPSLAVVPMMQEAEIPYISMASAHSITTNPKTGETYKWCFQTPQDNLHSGTWQALYVESMGWDQVCDIHSNDGYGQDCLAQTTAAMEAKNIEVSYSDSFESTDTEFPQIASVVASGCDAVVIGALAPGASNATTAARERVPNLPLVLGHGACYASFLDRAGAAAEGTVLPCGKLMLADLLPDDDPQKGGLLKYIADYAEFTGGEPISSFGGHAHDGLTWVVEAMGSLEEGLTLRERRAAIRDYLETQITDWPGIGGVFNITPDDHLGLTYDALGFARVENGTFVYYPPEEW